MSESESYGRSCPPALSLLLFISLYHLLLIYSFTLCPPLSLPSIFTLSSFTLMLTLRESSFLHSVARRIEAQPGHEKKKVAKILHIYIFVCMCVYICVFACVSIHLFASVSFSLSASTILYHGLESTWGGGGHE